LAKQHIGVFAGCAVQNEYAEDKDGGDASHQWRINMQSFEEVGDGSMPPRVSAVN
jgi:hypothetical protein